MNINLIIERFCEIKGATIESIINSKDRSDFCYSKYMLWYYLHYAEGVSTNTLSKIFKRNRRSIFRGIGILRHQMQYHKDIYMMYQSIKKELEGMDESTPSENMEEKD